MSDQPVIEFAQGLRVEVHVYSGKAKASMRTHFGVHEIPAEWVAKAISRNIPEMIDIAKAKEAEIQASEQ